MNYLLGIDIGTSGTKTVLFDIEGNTIASAVSEYPMYQPFNGWAEQDPEDWWSAVQITIQKVLRDSKVCPTDIKGIGLSGQMHGLVLLDRNGKVLRKSIIWCDQRTDKECEQITELVGRERLIEITGNPALTGFTASKILWVRNNEPELYDEATSILLPKDFIRYRLTGKLATDVSDASGMQLLDIRERDWSDEILQKLDIDKKLLGKVYESPEITGAITEDAAELTGLTKGIPVVGGAGDQAAAAVGNGIVKEGIVSSTIGTSGVVFAYTDKVTIDPNGRVHTFCHAVPGAWHVMGVTQAAGLSLKWFRDNFCQMEKFQAEEAGKDPYDAMNEAVERIEVGSDGIIYLPYLMGERTPHLDPFARGVFFGLSARHSKNHLLRGVMEGVGYSLKDCMEIIQGMDIPVVEVRASGGGGRSDVWRQIQADMFKMKVVTIHSEEGGALGVAILAGVGAGLFSNVQEACEKLIKTKLIQNPIEANKDYYEKHHQLYKSIYNSLKRDFQMANEL